MKKIFVVDDDKSILDVIKIILEEAKFEVRTFGDSSILSHLEKDKPDLILLDVHVGQEDGTQICRLLKKNQQTNSIPIILFSAHSRGEKAVLECGADCFIAKPFDIDNLVDTVRKTLGA